MSRHYNTQRDSLCESDMFLKQLSFERCKLSVTHLRAIIHVQMLEANTHVVENCLALLASLDDELSRCFE